MLRAAVLAGPVLGGAVLSRAMLGGTVLSLSRTVLYGFPGDLAGFACLAP
jgi:acetyl-CoA carboxylase beta subunit